MEGRNLVSWPAILGTLALVVLGLLAWELRWVLLVLLALWCWPWPLMCPCRS